MDQEATNARQKRIPPPIAVPSHLDMSQIETGQNSAQELTSRKSVLKKPPQSAPVFTDTYTKKNRQVYIIVGIFL